MNRKRCKKLPVIQTCKLLAAVLRWGIELHLELALNVAKLGEKLPFTPTATRVLSKLLQTSRTPER